WRAWRPPARSRRTRSCGPPGPRASGAPLRPALRRSGHLRSVRGVARCALRPVRRRRTGELRRRRRYSLPGLLHPGEEDLGEPFLGLTRLDDQAAPAGGCRLHRWTFGVRVVAFGERDDVLPADDELHLLHLLAPHGVGHLGGVGI